MQTIYKFPLDNTSGKYSFELPKDAEVLLVKVQRDVPCLWVKLDLDAPKIVRQFRLYGTGHPIEENSLYHHGSFFMQEGRFVFHLFEVIG